MESEPVIYEEIVNKHGCPFQRRYGRCPFAIALGSNRFFFRWLDEFLEISRRCLLQQKQGHSAQKHLHFVAIRVLWVVLGTAGAASYNTGDVSVQLGTVKASLKCFVFFCFGQHVPQTGMVRRHQHASENQWGWNKLDRAIDVCLFLLTGLLFLL